VKRKKRKNEKRLDKKSKYDIRNCQEVSLLAVQVQFSSYIKYNKVKKITVL